LGSDILTASQAKYNLSRMLQNHTDKLSAGLSTTFPEDLPCFAIAKWI